MGDGMRDILHELLVSVSHRSLESEWQREEGCRSTPDTQTLPTMIFEILVCRFWFSTTIAVLANTRAEFALVIQELSMKFPHGFLMICCLGSPQMRYTRSWFQPKPGTLRRLQKTQTEALSLVLLRFLPDHRNEFVLNPLSLLAFVGCWFPSLLDRRRFALGPSSTRFECLRIFMVMRKQLLLRDRDVPSDHELQRAGSRFVHRCKLHRSRSRDNLPSIR